MSRVTLRPHHKHSASPRRGVRRVPHNHRTLRLLTLLIALALTSAALVAVGESGGPRSGELETWDSPNPEGTKTPGLHWLSPRDGDRLTGTVELTWELGPDALRSLDVWVDDRHLLKVAPSDHQRVINTEYLENGLHQFELRAVDVTGKPRRAAVQVRVHNQDFSILRISRPQAALANGEELVLDITTRGSGFLPQADLTLIDSAFDPERISWTQPEPRVHRLQYRLSTTNQRPDGQYRVGVSLVDEIEPSIRERATARVDLSNTPPFPSKQPPVDISCSVFRPEPLLPSDETAHTLERIEAPTRVAVGAPISLRLHWATPEAGNERFLRVSIDGVRGYFALHGSCSLRDEIPLVAQRPSGADGYRIAVWPGNGLPVVHRLVVVR